MNVVKELCHPKYASSQKRSSFNFNPNILPEEKLQIGSRMFVTVQDMIQVFLFTLVLSRHMFCHPDVKYHKNLSSALIVAFNYLLLN